ncbi:MAG TPA: sugar transferase [Gaiellaceae bacterium]|nr:sugar transferase [Gaiellaceae bacterium]
MHGGDDISGPLVDGGAAVAFKHAADRVLAAAGLIVLSPVIAAISAWVRVDAGSPVIFRQRRAGRGGRAFELHKFRTLGEGPNLGDDPYGHLPDDPRITRSGRFLRATSLDELPQLYDVLRGKLSLVGPRADIVEQVANYEPHERRRLAVRPGITGWAQVNGRDAIPWEKRFELDVWYIEHWSLRLDLKIMLMTFSQLFRPRPEPVRDDLNIRRAKARGE